MFAAARTVVSFGIILQAAGFAKLLVIAAYFGAGATLDAYYLGLVIPTFVAGVSAGILQTGFVPAYVGVRARGELEVARRLGNITLTWTALTLCAVATLLTFSRGIAVPLLARGISDETRSVLNSAFTPLLWTAPISGVADAGALLLNAEGRFAAAAAAPLLNAIVGVIVLIALPGDGANALVCSLAAGLIVQVAIVFGAIRRAGFPLRPHFAFQSALPGMLGNVAVPVLLSMVLGNFIPLFIQTISARAGTGAVSAMGYASRLHNSLMQAVVISASSVLLPHFARLLAEGKRDELRNTLERVFAATLLFAAAALVLVATGGHTIIHLLLERGHFNAGDVELVAKVWLALTTGLFGATWGIFLARLLQAQRRLWLIFALGCLSVLLNVVFAISFLPIWGVAGVALANSVAYAVIMLLCHISISRTAVGLLSASARVFIVRAVLVNCAAYGVAVWWGGIARAGGALTVIAGQFLVVAAANLLLARAAPLGLSPRALLRR